ncbi:hypothetical protein OPT61_g9422 [Boeremia exigua]|uniref:Uncharacterized protein n=1 Tax=Boeremia exigua TaxID=749465 RepID=A0ACC2HU45_9PLEO|nr:hypothetical protein OPT61_g9422 [Boeremia exigua]
MTQIGIGCQRQRRYSQWTILCLFTGHIRGPRSYADCSEIPAPCVGRMGIWRSQRLGQGRSEDLRHSLNLASIRTLVQRPQPHNLDEQYATGLFTGRRASRVSYDAAAGDQRSSSYLVFFGAKVGTMEEWVTRLPLLEARSHFNVSLNTSAVSEPSWTSTNSTRAVIASLQLAQVQTLRTMHLALGVFSLALALLTVYRIVSDARRAAALQVTLRKQRFNSLQNVHPAETFPLALACGVVVSQIIFVSVQSTTLSSVLSNSCRMLAMITYPAIFAMGYITLVFGIETTLRSFKAERFSPRGKWNTIVCISVVVFFLVLTWIPTIAWPMLNRCFGGLIWFPMRYDLLTLVLLIILTSSLLLLAAIISIQLMRSADVDPNERIAASRMCYYLILTAVIYILVIPCEVQSVQARFDAALGGSRFAEASLFSSGMVISFFHLFLRTNANRLVIRPIEELRSQPKQKRPKLRLFGPSDLEMNISGPLALQGGHRPDSRQGLIDVGPEKNRFDFGAEYFERPDRVLTPGSKLQSPIDPTKWPLPPDMDEKETKKSGHERNKSSYSIFPTRAEDVPRLPATVYNPSRAAKGESRISKLAMRRFNRRSSVTDVKVDTPAQTAARQYKSACAFPWHPPFSEPANTSHPLPPTCPNSTAARAKKATRP